MFYFNNSLSGIECKCTLEAFVDKNNKPPVIYKRGILEAPYRIQDEIHSFKTDRYSVSGVDVYKETYGSEEDTVTYEFTFKDVVHHQKRG